MSHEQKRTTRRGFITTTATAGMGLYLAACGGSSSSSSSSAASSGAASSSAPAASSGTVTLNNLFKQQAGYSASDLAGMTKIFEAGQPPHQGQQHAGRLRGAARQDRRGRTGGNL